VTSIKKNTSEVGPLWQYFSWKKIQLQLCHCGTTSIKKIQYPYTLRHNLGEAHTVSITISKGCWEADGLQ